jgi:hypothetical protein
MTMRQTLSPVKHSVMLQKLTHLPFRGTSWNILDPRADGGMGGPSIAFPGSDFQPLRFRGKDLQGTNQDISLTDFALGRFAGAWNGSLRARSLIIARPD